MKPFFIFTAVFFLAGICAVAAQDLIILRDGNVIEAKVTEISPSEIRYKRFDHLDGPTIVVPAANVLSIRYANGKVETLNAASVNTVPSARKERDHIPQNTANTAMNPNKLNFGISANPLGLVTMGPSICLEFTKGNFNSEINLIEATGLLADFSWGFGFLSTFNYFWHSRIGGGYLGGGIGYLFFDCYIPGSYSYSYGSYYGYWTYAHSLTIGINGGYKFVTPSGFYARIGAFVGFDFGYIWDSYVYPVYIKPELAIGWTMR